jgi:hypothetical protein
MTSGNFRIGSHAPARSLALLSMVSLMAVLAGCGSDHGVVPTPPPPSPSPVTDEIQQGSFSGLGVMELLSVPFHNPKAGRIDAIADWTLGSNDVDVYLVKAGCTVDLFNSRQCAVLAFSESATAKPEKITASNAAVGDYQFLIGNVGPETESISFQILITSVGAASNAVGGAAASGQPSLAKGIFQKAVRPR